MRAQSAMPVPDPLGTREWAAVDVETSGLRTGQDRVLSVAVITLDPAGRPTGEFSTLLNPGVDPGPVHIHGLTARKLRGAPVFDEVAPTISAMLAGRTMVAHNAPFDYGFLAHEFARARSHLPVADRLCTLALNRILRPPTPDLKLATLARHYGVRQRKAHDALDDTRVLTGVFRGSLGAAAAMSLDLPFVACPPRQETRFEPTPPKTPCPFRNPGRFEGSLQQGMKVAFSGESAMSRAELIERSVAVGLNAMGSVSKHTSLLVTNAPVSGSAKVLKARAAGVPMMGEREFLHLLSGPVCSGIARDGGAGAVGGGRGERAVGAPVARAPLAHPGSTLLAHPVVPEAVRPRPTVPEAASPPTAPVGAVTLAGRRVLVMGGPHADAAVLRGRIAELGGSAAVNLSARVTDVVLLPGGSPDKRLPRVTELGIPVHDPAWVETPAGPVPPPVVGRGPAPAASTLLPRGGVVDLPESTTTCVVATTWAKAEPEVDVVALRLDGDGRVGADTDVVFYNAPESPDGTVRLHTDGATGQSIVLDLARLPESVQRVAIAAAVAEGHTFADVGPLAVSAALGPGSPELEPRAVATATLDAPTTEQVLVLAEVYRRRGRWRLRAVGLGYSRGLGSFLAAYGVEVAG